MAGDQKGLNNHKFQREEHGACNKKKRGEKSVKIPIVNPEGNTCL
jgi:hypothetical protein